MVAGAIPVVTDDLILPFNDLPIFSLGSTAKEPPPMQSRLSELWAECAVVVQQSDIVWLPSILGGMSDECVDRRQRACQELLEASFNSLDKFFVTMALLLRERASALD